MRLSGARVKMISRVPGPTNHKCDHVAGAENSTHDLAATIYELLGVHHKKIYRNIDGRPTLVTDNGKPIRGSMASTGSWLRTPGAARLAKACQALARGLFP